MMKNPSYCYKFYWLEAIVNLISEDKKTTNFDELIDEMIANAWYSVMEYHIHLSGVVAGDVRDGLERAIYRLSDLSDLNNNASKMEIKDAIKLHSKEMAHIKKQLIHMVPYRALAGFFVKDSTAVNWDSIPRLVAYIQMFDKNVAKLPYVLGDSTGLKREVIFNPSWMRMIQDNTVAILGWIQYEKVKWLQNNNPDVPGLVYKLDPLGERSRKLGHVHNLWDAIMKQRSIIDVFNERPIDRTEYDVDHFVPWSFVMNDELWNLMPMDSSLNSIKSNKLPKWEPFFIRFANNQYLMYEEVFSNVEIHRLYEKCYRDNLHSIWANQELYIPGNTKEEFYNILEKNMRPVYDSAKRQGYQLWDI
ncbi:MAG: HNH endonuclease [Eubacterium sp.]|nr:HNH endonuclease [Eubacterium sp.]